MEMVTLLSNSSFTRRYKKRVDCQYPVIVNRVTLHDMVIFEFTIQIYAYSTRNCTTNLIT